MRVLIDCITKDGNAFVYADSPVGAEWPRLVPLASRHPALRDVEYRLTLDELVTLCYDSENYPYFEDDEERTNFVKQWLANRKEAGNE